MKTRIYWVLGTLAIALIVLPLSTMGQDQPGDPDPAATAFRAGDFRKAHDLWQARAYQGDPEAQFNLGYLYETGTGVETDYEVAFNWYNEAAKEECRTAQCNLASLYMTGRGVPVNHGEAIRLFAKCVSPGGTCKGQVGAVREYVEGRLKWYADQDYADAQYQLGSMALDRGDFVNATAWVQKAAQLGHGLAQVALANSYLNGMGVDMDVEQGTQLLFQAMLAHRDDAAVLRGAKTTLAAAYSAGLIETSKPLISAYVWARLALEDYPDTAALPGMMYDRMAGEAKQSMTDGQVGTAFYYASEWSELFAAGLPGVTEEHLRTLTVPQ